MVTKPDLFAAKAERKHDPVAALRGVPHTDDIVDYTIACILALAPSLSAAMMAPAAKQVRETFGGDRPYIARRQGDGRSARNDAIRRDHQAGERIPMLMRRYGLGRTQLHQIINGGAD